MKAPTEKQIQLVENICSLLEIKNFPSSSKEFTRFTFSQFIAAHLNEYINACEEVYEDEWDENHLDYFWWL